MRRWLPGVALLVVLVLAYAGLLTSGERRRAPTVEQPEEVAAAETVEEVQERPPVVQEPPPAAAPAAEETAAPPTENAPSRWNARGNPTWTLKAAFEQEPRDALWADGMEREIRRVLGDDALPPDLVRSASCQKSVCRIELRWLRDPDAGMKRLNALIAGNWAPTMGLEYPSDPDAKRALDVYIVRKGYTLEDVARAVDAPPPAR